MNKNCVRVINRRTEKHGLQATRRFAFAPPPHEPSCCGRLPRATATALSFLVHPQGRAFCVQQAEGSAKACHRVLQSRFPFSGNPRARLRASDRLHRQRPPGCTVQVRKQNTSQVPDFAVTHEQAKGSASVSNWYMLGTPTSSSSKSAAAGRFCGLGCRWPGAGIDDLHK